MVIHTRDETFKCHLCKSSFRHEGKLKLHLSKCHDIKSYGHTCRFCQRKLETKFEWARHELLHTGWKYYKCLKCDREFLEASGFARHIKGKWKTSTCPGIKGMTKEEEEKFRTDCKKDWESEHERILGNVTNFDEKDFEIKKPVYHCRFCQKEHDSKIEWAKHELKHTGWKYYKCAKCGWETSGASGFREHINDIRRTDCTGIKGMTRDEEKAFREKSRKNWESEHARILGNATSFNESDYKVPIEKPIYKCRFCSRIAKSRSEWAVHELRHTGWIQFKCIKCGKECANASSFQCHAFNKVGSECPGGRGLSKEELKTYRRQSANDWESAHARILGEKTGHELDELIERSGFQRAQITSGNRVKTRTSTKICQNENDPRNMNNQSTELKSNHDSMKHPRIKECRVVLRRLNIITVTNY